MIEITGDSWELLAGKDDDHMKINAKFLWFALLLALLEVANTAVVAWVVGFVPWGFPLGLAFAFLGVAGVVVTAPNSPKWLAPAWVVVSPLINGALWGQAAFKLAVMFFVLVDPMIPWALATAGFGFTTLWLVNKTRETGAGPPPSE